MSKRRNSRKVSQQHSLSRHREKSLLYRRHLRYEPLEDRRLLAVVTVNTLADTINFNDGVTSLREAIFATNTVPGADTIEFADSLTAGGPASLVLTQGLLGITDALTINGPGADLLTIRAFDPTPTQKNGDGSGIFSIDDHNDASLIDVSISGLTLTGADPSFGVRGGAITAKENLTVEDCIIAENSASSIGGVGGGIYSYTLVSANLPNSLTVRRTTLSGNVGGLDGGAIRKETGTLVIEDCTISNNSAENTGGGVSTHFNSSVIVHISGTTITGNRTTVIGGAGGGVFVNQNGNLTVTSSTISGNSSDWGGGIYALACPATVTDSVLIGNSATTSGGAIAGGYPLTVIRCTISGNSAGTPDGRTGRGGGITGRRMLIVDSTISGNSARDGAGIASSSGISPTTVLTEIIGSTISGNIASREGGGIFKSRGPLVVRHSTIADNTAAAGKGGGIFSTDDTLISIDVTSTIVAQNTGDDVVYIGDVNHFISHGFNLIGTGNGVSNFDQPGDQTGIVDPLLGALADNGGPTQTHALLAGSPAINQGDLSAVAGVNGVPLYDQRGESFTRVFNGRIDIGAFEYQEPSDLNLLVDTLVDESDGNYGRFDLSLREAIELANMYPSIDTIHFDPALTLGGPATILLVMGELRITDALTIDGPGADQLTIDASGSDTTPGVFDGQGSRIFNISDGTSDRIEVSIGGLRLTGGDTTGGGGALSSSENLNLADMVVEENAGGLSVVQSFGKIIMDRTHIVNNTLLFVQGGVSALNTSETTIRDSEISFNVGGGGITAGVPMGTTFLIADTTIADNAGTGAIVKSFSNFQLLRSAITGNSGTGGGLSFLGGGTVLISDSTFAHNTQLPVSSGSGGGGANISTSGDASVAIHHSSFIDNRASSGAGLKVIGNVTITDSEFRGNMITAFSGDGGGLILSNESRGTSKFVITGTTFTENVATRGGGVFIELVNNSTAMLSDNTFIANTSDNQGGGIAILAIGGSTTTATINRTTIHGNHSAVGGGLWLSASGSSRIHIEDSTIDGNSARGEGAGGATVSASGTSEVTFLQTTISGNSATGSGGGLSVNAASTSLVSLAHSTITKNGFGLGGGVSNNGNGILQISHSIIAGNFGLSSSPDIRGNVNLSFSLIGNSAGSGLTPAPLGSPDAHGNLIGGFTAASVISPKLAPLANNGGPTMTHALLGESPAINAGDPAAVAGVNGVPLNDQRGATFTRVYGVRIDIGAFEFQPTDHILGDFNRDGAVDAGDYLIGRKQSGLSVQPGTGADANGDGVVNDADLAIWRFSFGLVQAAADSNLVQQSETAAIDTPLLLVAEQPAAVSQTTSQELVRSLNDLSGLAATFGANSMPLRSGMSVLSCKSSTSAIKNVTRFDAALEAWLASSFGYDNRDVPGTGPLKSSHTATDTVERPESLDAIIDEAFSAL